MIAVDYQDARSFLPVTLVQKLLEWSCIQMNKLALLLLPLMVAGPAFAGGPRIRGQRNVYHEEYCYKNVEKYILVTMMNMELTFAVK